MRRTSSVEAEGTQQRGLATARSRALLAGCLGNLVEWYDFALYGAFAAVIAVTFFPSSDALGGLLATFTVFGVAFLARPAGALVFGHYGDRTGRRLTLSVAMVLMAVGTAGIGMLPGFADIGWLAPALLVVFRGVQGIAVGGEYAGSAALVVEYAPVGRRGWYGGWQWATVGFGIALGIASVALLAVVTSPTAVRAWAWRLPFLLALPLGVVGLYVRARVPETPAFRAMRDAGTISRAPLREAVVTLPREVAVGFAVVAAVSVAFNVFYVFVPAFLTARGEGAPGRTFAAAVVGLMLGSAGAPMFGALSDRIGRRPMVIGGVAALLVLATPAYTLVIRGDVRGMLTGYALVGMPLGALALTAFLAELFPTHLRYSGLALTYGLPTAVFGGTAPLVAAALVRFTGAMRAPLWYTLGLTSIAAVCVLFAPETAGRHDDLGS